MCNENVFVVFYQIFVEVFNGLPSFFKLFVALFFSKNKVQQKCCIIYFQKKSATKKSGQMIFGKKCNNSNLIEKPFPILVSIAQKCCEDATN